MIRDKDKIYAEIVSSNTVLVPDDLLKNKYVVSASGFNVKTFNPGPKRIMITNANGDADSFSYNQPDKLIGVDGNGRFELVSQAPSVPPPGRVLILETTSYAHIQLEPFYWYEVEIIGGGGGGGAGVGRWHDGDSAFLKGTAGGAGAYLKTAFKTNVFTTAIFRPGTGGKKGSGTSWIMVGTTPTPTTNIDRYNRGGDGGKMAIQPGMVESPAQANDGADPVYMFNGTLTPLIKTGGAGINSGANGGDSEMELGHVVDEGSVPSDAQGVGGSGGGGNGLYGGDGGKSKYTGNTGVARSASGGGGGAGGGLAYAGDGGGTVPSKPIGYVGAGGGNGVFVSPDDYTLSSGGGGGGASSIFQWGLHFIVCGGGGGGAGAGYGGVNESTPGADGTCSETSYSSANNGGVAGIGVNFNDMMDGDFISPNGGTGGNGIIRLWRCE